MTKDSYNKDVFFCVETIWLEPDSYRHEYQAGRVSDRGNTLLRSELQVEDKALYYELRRWDEIEEIPPKLLARIYQWSLGMKERAERDILKGDSSQLDTFREFSDLFFSLDYLICTYEEFQEPDIPEFDWSKEEAYLKKKANG